MLALCVCCATVKALQQENDMNQHSCYCESPSSTSGFDVARIVTTRNGVDMLCAAMTLLKEQGLEAPDVALWDALQMALKKGAVSFGLAVS
jgi:hypothetical protein